MTRVQLKSNLPMLCLPGSLNLYYMSLAYGLVSTVILRYMTAY